MRNCVRTDRTDRPVLRSSTHRYCFTNSNKGHLAIIILTPYIEPGHLIHVYTHSLKPGHTHTHTLFPDTCTYVMYININYITVKPVYNGHCISRSPLRNSQVTESQMGLQCAFQPALTGHLSITARLLSPKWVYSVHIFQPALTGHLFITASFLGPKGYHY